MIRLSYLSFGFILALALQSCNGYNLGLSRETDTVFVHDTIRIISEGTYTYNLPCRIISINPQVEGKALLFLWLHGGVYDRPKHNFYVEWNHWDCSQADDMILRYLQIHGVKAIALFPICNKADNPALITWKDCYDDIKHMIDDLVDKGIVDPERIYVAGSSDGGTGTWDYAALHPETFAAALPMSCGNPQYTTIPVYFFNTSSEMDRTQDVQRLVQQGCNIRYKHCEDVTHEGDAKECTDEFLDEFFANVKK